MSATLDPNPIPRHAVHAWMDEVRIYIAIPIKGKAPFIDAFPNTTEGLGEALRKMRNYHTRQAAPPVYVMPPRAPVAAPTARDPLSTNARVRLAQDILARLIITPKRG